jgi:hypothetical protein
MSFVARRQQARHLALVPGGKLVILPQSEARRLRFGFPVHGFNVTRHRCDGTVPSKIIAARALPVTAIRSPPNQHAG